MQLVPPNLVPIARALLVEQGYAPTILDANGNVALADLFSLAFNQMEFQTALTPHVSFRLDGPSDPTTQAILQKIKPTIVLRGPAGTVQIAPYGAAQPLTFPSFTTGEKLWMAGCGIAASYLFYKAITM